MITLLNKEDAEPIIKDHAEDVRIIVQPNLINKFSLYLAGVANKGVEIVGVGPMAMRAYYSLWDYARLVGFGLEKGYRVFITKDGKMFSEGNWYIEFRLIGCHGTSVPVNKAYN